MNRLGVLGLLGLASCGKVVGDLPGDGGSSPDGPLNAVDSVRELRLASPRAGDAVALKGVVVVGRTTSVAPAAGVVYVQDLGGGEGSGIRLLCLFDSACPTSRSQIEGLALGQVIDVTGVFDVTAAPAEPQILRFTMALHGTATPVATTVDATLVAHDRASAANVQPWLGAYVKVNGPLTIDKLDPAALSFSCPERGDANNPDTAYRGVLIRHSASGKDLAVQTVELDYCVSQCGRTCGEEMMTNDPVTAVGGVVVVGDRQGGQAELLIVPTRDADLPH